MCASLPMRCRQNKASNKSLFPDESIAKGILLSAEADRKPLFRKLFSAVANQFNNMSPRLPKSNCLHMYCGANLQKSGGACSASIQELPCALGFMETSLISKEVFSDLLCLICFVCSMWPSSFYVIFLTIWHTSIYFSAIIIHMKKVFFPFVTFFSNHTYSFGECSHD